MLRVSKGGADKKTRIHAPEAYLLYLAISAFRRPFSASAFFARTASALGAGGGGGPSSSDELASNNPLVVAGALLLVGLDDETTSAASSSLSESNKSRTSDLFIPPFVCILIQFSRFTHSAHKSSGISLPNAAFGRCQNAAPVRCWSDPAGGFGRRM